MTHISILFRYNSLALFSGDVICKLFSSYGRLSFMGAPSFLHDSIVLQKVKFERILQSALVTNIYTLFMC